jgi:hypothetical protein
MPIVVQTAPHLCSWLHGRVSRYGQNFANMHTRKDVFPMGPSREDGQELRKVVYKVGRYRDMSPAPRRYVDHGIRPYQMIIAVS